MKRTSGPLLLCTRSVTDFLSSASKLASPILAGILCCSAAWHSDRNRSRYSSCGEEKTHVKSV